MPRGSHKSVAQAFLTREHKLLRAAFLRFAVGLRRPAFMAQVVRRLTRHDVNGVIKLMEPALKQFAGELSESFARGVRFERRLFSPHFKVRKSYDVIAKQPRFPYTGDPDAAAIMRDSELEFISDFTDDQRETVRNALADALDKGYSPLKAARTFRDAIGLTDNQAAAVQNYRDLLEANSAEALNRELRDARSDSKLTGAIERGDVLADTQIDRMVSRYSDNMLAYRADTIALTESLRAVSAGRQQALSDLSDEYEIDEDSIVRTWNATQDDRTRDTHAEMDGQQVRGFEPFISPSGARLRYPGDPNAPPEETIRCRCVETYEVIPPDEA